MPTILITALADVGIAASGFVSPAAVVPGAAAALGGLAAGAVAVRCARRAFGVHVPHVAVAVACVGVALALALRLGSSVFLAPLLVFGWAGVAISSIDLRTHVIPTRLLRVATAVAVPLLCVAAVVDAGPAAALGTAGSAAVGGAGGWLVMHLVWMAARGGLGYGDVRLAGYLGLHLGLAGFTTVLAGLLAGFAIASAIGVVGIVALGRGADHRFALGPSLVAGALAVIWWIGPTALGA